MLFPFTLSLLAFLSALRFEILVRLSMQDCGENHSGGTALFNSVLQRTAFHRASPESALIVLLLPLLMVFCGVLLRAGICNPPGHGELRWTYQETQEGSRAQTMRCCFAVRH